MRIAYLTQMYPPMINGVSISVQQQAQGMNARGHEVLILCASPTGKPTVQEENNIKIIGLRSSRNPLRAYQRTALWPFNAIYRELKIFQPDVIHLHDPFTTGLAGIFAGRNLGVPLTQTTHQLPWFAITYLPEIGWLRKMMEAAFWHYGIWLNKQTYNSISPTTTVAREVAQHTDLPPEVISNGMNLERFHPPDELSNERAVLCKKYKLDPNRPIILHVGRLDLDKKVGVVIQAAAKAMKDSDAQLLVVGNGQKREALTELAACCGIGERTRFTGFVHPHEELPALYRIADVFVTASEIETQGLVLLEALASALPVVAVRATCVPEIIHDGSNGYLVNPGNVENMTQRIIDVLANPGMAKHMGVAGRKVAEQHSVEASIEQHEIFYRKMITQPVIHLNRVKPSFLKRFMHRLEKYGIV